MAFFLLLLLGWVSTVPVMIFSKPHFPLPEVDTETLCTNLQFHKHFTCEMHNANLKIARLETILEESVPLFDSKINRLQELDKQIDEMGALVQDLQNSLLNIKGNSLHGDKRLLALEEEVRLLWDALRKNIVDLHTLESKAEETEKRLEALTSRVEKMADIITEQWVEIQRFEQALQISELRALEAQKLVGYTKCSFLKFVDGLYGDILLMITKMWDVPLFGKGSVVSSFASRSLHQIRTIMSATTHLHHELQTFIRQKMERNGFKVTLAKEEIIFFMASAIIAFPVMGVWMLVSLQFS